MSQSVVSQGGHTGLSRRNTTHYATTIGGVGTSYKRPSRDRCFVVLGKTGNGKSTVGNIILGENKFQVKAGMAPMAELPLTEQVVSTANFRELKVVVVLDIVNQIHDEHQRRKHVLMAKALEPDAVLLAIKCDARYTREEFELYRKVREYWPEVTQRLVVAFTFGENCADIESELKDASPELQEVLRDASGRYCVFGKTQQLVEKSRHRYELHTIVDRMAPVTGAGASRFPRDDKASSSRHSTTLASTPSHPVPVETSTETGLNSSSSRHITIHAATTYTPSHTAPIKTSTETSFNSSHNYKHALTERSFSSPAQATPTHTDVSSMGPGSHSAATAQTPEAAYTPDWARGMTPLDVRRNAKPFRILIIGKTGSGKSTVGNIMLGDRSKFFRRLYTTTETKTAQAAETTLKEGFTVKVIDTPDFYSMNKSEYERQKEVLTWKCELSGELPDTILLCVPAHCRVSGSEITLCSQIMKDLGYTESDVRHRLTIAFTFVDQNFDIDKDLSRPYPELKALLDSAGGRLIVLCGRLALPQEEFHQQKDRALGLLFKFHGIKHVDQTSPVSGPFFPVTAAGAGAMVLYRQTTGAAAVVPYGQSAPGTDRSILIVGKTGNGKSTVGNMILRRAAYPVRTDARFEVASGMSTVTTFTAKEQLVVNGRDRWTVVDTPDINNLSTFFNRTEQQHEVDSWRDMMKPGPDVILLVVRCDVQYTYEELRVYENIKRLWDDTTDFTSRLVVAFTFPVEKHIQRTLETASTDLLGVLRDARNRLVVFEKGKEEESVKELLYVMEDIKADSSDNLR